MSSRFFRQIWARTGFRNVENKRLDKRLSLSLIRDLSLSLRSALTNETAGNQVIDEFIQAVRISHMIKWGGRNRSWLVKSEARLASSMYECRVAKDTQNLLNFNLLSSSEIVLRRISITKARANWSRTVETWTQSISLLLPVRRVTVATHSDLVLTYQSQ